MWQKIVGGTETLLCEYGIIPEEVLYDLICSVHKYIDDIIRSESLPAFSSLINTQDMMSVEARFSPLFATIVVFQTLYSKMQIHLQPELQSELYKFCKPYI